MPEFEGINVTKFDAGTNDANWIDQGLIKSSIRVWSDRYVADGTEVIADTIVVAVLPDGAVVHGTSVQTSNIGGGTATVDLGDANTATLYKTAVAANASDSDTNLGGSQYVIGTNSGDDRILLTIAGANLAASDEIKSQIFYTN